jgi:hypothetical protein
VRFARHPPVIGRQAPLKLFPVRHNLTSAA